MKKTIAILLVLVLAGVGLFAALPSNTSTTLDLNTSITARYVVKISEAAVTGATMKLKRTSFEGLEAVTKIDFDAEATVQQLSKTLNVSYLSNYKGKASVSVTVVPMKSLTTGVEIGYDVLVGATTYPVAIGATGVPITFMSESASVNGMRIESQAFTVTMRESDWDLAPEGNDYTTKWTVNLVTV